MSGMERLCVLVRHGQSEWNLQNLFTGWQDPPLTELGRQEAREAGRRLKARGIVFDKAYTSCLSRAQDTLARTVPYYLRNILPDILDGKRVIVAAHGNSLRAMTMGMEGLSPAEILSREIATGIPILYRLKANSRIEGREVLEK